MKKLILILSIIFLLIIGISIKVYVTAMQTVKTAEDKALEIARKNIHFKKIEDFHVYHGLETVYVIEGIKSNGQKIIVWIPEKSKKMVVKRANSGISKQEVIQKVEQKKHPKQIIAVRLGMEGNIPLWEVYYQSNSNLINYYYVEYGSGKWLKEIENL